MQRGTYANEDGHDYDDHAGYCDQVDDADGSDSESDYCQRHDDRKPDGDRYRVSRAGFKASVDGQV